ncbi:MAG: hypothetical protein ACQERJ_10460 [Bacillota bacterium]
MKSNQIVSEMQGLISNVKGAVEKGQGFAVVAEETVELAGLDFT